VLRRIRADERTGYAVILTTSKSKGLLSGYRNGCNSYIRKPVDLPSSSPPSSRLTLLADAE